MTPDAASTRPEFTQLVERYGGELFAYLFRQVSSAMDADDCLQDTFLRAFRAYDRTEEGSNYRAWLYKIATNVARTHYQRRKRQGDREQTLNPGDGSSEPGPAKLLEERLELERVRMAVKSLPDKQRAALILRKYQGLSYAEIGAVIACSADSARANVYQALRSLRIALKTEVVEAGNERIDSVANGA
ncbi:MAG: RNA polymerase sigma factor [Anaerolineales bacterium]|jgi:RNA polymerase sigma-70 factor (ECF subfamily)